MASRPTRLRSPLHCPIPWIIYAVGKADRQVLRSGLADLAARLGCPRLQPAQTDNGGQCGRAAAGLELDASAGSTETVHWCAMGRCSCRASAIRTGPRCADRDLLWQYSPALEPGVDPFLKRGLALWGEQLYLGTSDVHVLALNVHTGTHGWDTGSATSKTTKARMVGPWWPKARSWSGPPAPA